MALLDEPVFDGRNGAIAPAASEPIFPLHVEIAGGGIRLVRATHDPTTGDSLLVLASGGTSGRVDKRDPKSGEL